MLDIHSFIMTLVLTEGGQPASFIYFRDLESPLCMLGDDGETLVVDRTADPSGVGLRVMALARHLHGYVNRAMGPYVLRGRMERPLQQAHLDHQLELWSRSNPVALLNPVLGRVSPEQVGSVGPVLYGRPPYFAGLLDYPVLGVIHSVWRSVTGGLGIVVSNWTGDAGGFSAVFDPELYGLLPDTLFRFRFVGEDPEISRISEVFRGRVMMTTDAAADDMPAFELDHLVPRQAALFELVVES
jgi:hypothetical protein